MGFPKFVVVHRKRGQNRAEGCFTAPFLDPLSKQAVEDIAARATEDFGA